MILRTKYIPMEDEYIGKDGKLYCKKCNTSRSFIADDGEFEIRCKCKCQMEEINKYNEDMRKKYILDQLQDMKEKSLLGERYKDMTFDKLEIRGEEHQTIVNRLKTYCEKFESNNNGIGVYLFGKSGSGKTVLTACMLDNLINQYVDCLFVNMTKIKQQLLQVGFQNQEKFLKKLYTVDVLFIDDFATENVKKDNNDTWIQEIIYDIVNTRYNNSKPIIFTSNYSLKECVEDRGILKKTIDRMYESTVQIKLDLPSYRLKEKKDIYF